MPTLPKGQMSSGARVIQNAPAAGLAAQQPQRLQGTVLPHANFTAKNATALMQANHWDSPKSVTITVTSTDLAGGPYGPQLVYLFNRPSNQDVTDNGSGANSVAYQYQDGKGGLRLDYMTNKVRGNMGIPCYGVAIRMLANGAADPTGLGQANPFFIWWNTFNRSDSFDLNSTDGQSRKDFDTSIQVWSIPDSVNIPQWGQFGFTIGQAPAPAAGAATEAATCTFYFDEMFINTI